MKKITLIFSLLVAMFTTAMAQETISIDLSTGTFDGTVGGKENSPSYSRWTSAEGVYIVSTDANSDTEIATMKYYNNKFQLDVTTDVTNPSGVGAKYTIVVPEGYVVTEMKVKNSSSRNEFMEIDYNNGNNTEKLNSTTAEKTIPFAAGYDSFYLRGQVGKCIYITSLTITKVGSDNEGDGNEGEGEGGDNNQGGEGEGEVEGGDNNQGGEGEGEVEGGDNNQGGEVEGGDNNEGNEGEVEGGDNNEGNEGEVEGGDNEGDNNEGEGGDNDETSINEVKVENVQVIYDLTGRRVNEITKAGIYIINGKKVIK